MKIVLIKAVPYTTLNNHHRVDVNSGADYGGSMD